MAPYSGPAIDTHHHIWRRADVGWLADPPILRMFGDCLGIRRDYPVEEFMNDIVPHMRGVRNMLYWDKDPVR